LGSDGVEPCNPSNPEVLLPETSFIASSSDRKSFTNWMTTLFISLEYRGNQFGQFRHKINNLEESPFADLFDFFSSFFLF